jgi:hypothetical protein
MCDKEEPMTALDERSTAPEDRAGAVAEQRAADAANLMAPVSPTDSGTSRRRDADEQGMLWGMLAFFGLGMYAAVFVIWGVWLGG